MINVQGLRFTYPGNSEETIRSLNFNIEKGEIFGFLGPSGSGKSTTQNIILGILKQYTGNVQIANREISSLNPHRYETIGAAFEFPNFYTKLTALENLNFFRSLYSGETEKPESLLELVGLEKDGKTRVSDYSKGMKMRLNFCRAFLNKPEVVFLDEPTSGLDPVNAKKIKNIILEKKAQGTTLFVTTHNMQVAEDICDRVAFIIDGKIPLIDSPRELKLQKGKRRVAVESRQNGKTVKNQFDLDGIGTNKSFLDILKKETVETIHTEEATLEDIFIDVTGRSLS